MGTVKRFVRTLLADLGRHNAWGLLLPIAQHAANSLPRGPNGISPNQLVFASFYTPDAFIIPHTEACLASDELTVDVTDGNYFDPSANFIHRATYFQQLVVNKYYDAIDASMDRANQRAPGHAENIAVGQQVLIDWPNNRQPSSLHPLRRGPYIVTRVVGNVLHLTHAINPLPRDQPFKLTWSRAARIYTFDVELARDAFDPSATMVPTGPPGHRAIDCVLGHELDPSFDETSDTSDMRYDVRSQLYSCRVWAPVSLTSPARPNRTFAYDQIKHTVAFENYVSACPFLTGHRPCFQMPLTWNPRAVAPNLRPLHVPELAEERGLPVVDDVDPDHSDVAHV
jgi:hypothetical protein